MKQVWILVTYYFGFGFGFVVKQLMADDKAKPHDYATSVGIDAVFQSNGPGPVDHPHITTHGNYDMPHKLDK